MSTLEPELLDAFEALLERREGARAVFADRLLERGNPLGELMGLRAQSRKSQRRFAKIGQRTRLDVIFAPMLDPVLEGELWEGLPDRITLSPNESERFDSPFWGTVTHLCLTKTLLPRRHVIERASKGVGWRWLDSLHLGNGQEVILAAELGWNAFSSVQVDHIHRPGMDCLADPHQWPRLRRVQFLRTSPPANLRGLYARQLDEIVVSRPDEHLDWWLRPGPRRLVFSERDLDYTVDPLTWCWTLTPKTRDASVAEGRAWLMKLPRNRRANIVVGSPMAPTEHLPIHRRPD